MVEGAMIVTCNGPEDVFPADWEHLLFLDKYIPAGSLLIVT